MKEIIQNLVQKSPTALGARNTLREYLQARILGLLQDAGAMIPLAFHGGTSLRFLFDMNRYSEDLDFALECAHDQYDFDKYLESIGRGFRREGYNVDFKVSDKTAVHKAFVRFPGLLFELGISTHQNEILAVKLEIDTRPPSGSLLSNSIVRKHLLLNLQHHDRSSLLSGKLHALFYRKYTKGRDIYDLLWYLSDKSWPAPNLGLLNNALKQTQWEGPEITLDNWRKMLMGRLKDIGWKEVQTDVKPFLESEREVAFLTKENLEKLLKKD